MDKKIFAQRLITIRKEKGLSQEDLAAAVGLSRFPVIDWEAGRKAPDLSTASKLAEILGVSLDFLAGSSMKDADSSPDSIENKDISIPVIKGESWIQLPLYSQMTAACAGAGNGHANTDAEIDSWQWFPMEIYGKFDPRTPPYMIHVEGDSMEDADIHDGAVVIVNPAEEISDGEAALVCWNRDQVAIKLLYWLPDRGVELHAANPEHKKIYTFTREDIEDGHLVLKGKIMWSGQRPKRMK